MFRLSQRLTERGVGREQFWAYRSWADYWHWPHPLLRDFRDYDYGM